MTAPPGDEPLQPIPTHDNGHAGGWCIEVSQDLETARHFWQRATEHLHHHPATITVDAPPQPQGAPVSLLETATTALAVARAAEEPLRALLDEHFPNLIALGQQVESSRLIQGAIKAEEALPQPVKDAFSALLEAHVGPVQQPVAEVPAEPQPEEQAA